MLPHYLWPSEVSSRMHTRAVPANANGEAAGLTLNCVYTLMLSFRAYKCFLLLPEGMKCHQTLSVTQLAQN